MPQPRVFHITTFNRRGNADGFLLTLCEQHGQEFLDANVGGLRMHEESHIRTLVREVRRPWGRIHVVARPLREGEEIKCDDCATTEEEEQFL